jgi:transcriptional regulator with XRE-family HTH domain
MDDGKDTGEIRKRVAAAIQNRRKAKGMSQGELADAAGCSIETLSNAERAASLPGLALFLDIARLLEIDVLALVNATNDRRKVSKSRAALEADGHRLITALDDRHLAYLVKMARIFDEA